ncbi:MAG: polyprenyl synthetase family protein [Alphaproteobacteria bacterium]|nr:polyprenyl synthetase family protein [Alphaproteobacteria bacterium]
MLRSQKKSTPSGDKSALQTLAECLETDMNAVNGTIMVQMQSPVALIPQLAGYLIASGGKRIRPLLTLACTQIFDGDMKRAHGLAACVEFIHTATLLHDDVVDESQQRRGQDSANHIFGNQASVLVGDFLFARAFQLMVADGSLEVLRILSDAAAIIAQGEVLQLSAANNIATTLDQYLEIIRAKTAALFAAACEVGPVIADVPNYARAMAEYGLNLGIVFQITDDILDYTGGLGKDRGDDFREGKMTAPVIFALKNANNEERAFWTRCLQNKEQRPDDFERALVLLQQHQALERTRELIAIYAQNARIGLQQMPATALRDLLIDLVSETAARA